MNNALTADAANTKPSTIVIVALKFRTRWLTHIPPHAVTYRLLQFSLVFYAIKHTAFMFPEFESRAAGWNSEYIRKVLRPANSINFFVVFLCPQENYALEPKFCTCFMLFMQASQHQRQNFRSKTALRHWTQFLHNATLEIWNSKFSPNDQLHSCAAYSNSPFLPSSLLSCLSSLETYLYQRKSGHNLGTLTAVLFGLLMRKEKWMDRMVSLDSSQGLRHPNYLEI